MNEKNPQKIDKKLMGKKKQEKKIKKLKQTDLRLFVSIIRWKRCKIL